MREFFSTASARPRSAHGRCLVAIGPGRNPGRLTAVEAAAAFLILLGVKINSAWLILAFVVAGVAHELALR